MSFNHLIGTLDVTGVDALARIDSFAGDPIRFDKVEIVHATFEARMAESLAALPPALHPSIPGHISLLIVRCADSLLGPFSLAQVRIGCRAGIKPRGFCLGAVTDSAVVADALSSRWGFRCRFGAIALSKRYHRVSVHAEL